MSLLKDKGKRNALRHSLYETLATQGETLAETVKGLRKILGKDQAAFAKYVGISLSALRRIEQEQGNVTLATIDKILKRFSLTIRIKTQEPKAEASLNKPI